MYDRRMKTIVAIVATCALASLIGCGSKQTTVMTGPDGEKVTSDTQGNMTFTDDKGNRVDVKAGQESWTAESSDGAKTTVTKEGMTSTNEKGETFSMGVGTVSESELGLPFYPGSTAIEHRDMKADADGQHTVLSVRATEDAPSKVVEFYKSKVKGATVTTTDQIATMGGKLPDGGDLTLSAIINGKQTEISVGVTRK